MAVTGLQEIHGVTKIAVNDGNAQKRQTDPHDPMTAMRAFGRGDRLMLTTVKATLLVLAFARFTVIAFRAGFRSLSQGR
jgi:hypothetical protein